jgi:hypothetical protein
VNNTALKAPILDMKTLKLFFLVASLIVFTTLTSPLYGADETPRNGEPVACEKCETFPGLENLKDLASDLNFKIASKLVSLKQHLYPTSPLNHDIAHLQYLKESQKGKFVFWYTVLEF